MPDTKNKDTERFSTAISSMDHITTHSPTTIPTSIPTNNFFEGQHNITLSPPVNSTKHTSNPSLSPSTTVIHSFTTMQPTTGRFFHDNTPLKTSINKKGFLKIDSINVRDAVSYFTWHTAFHVHCQMNGVFCPSIKDMAQDNDVGHGWSQL